MIVNDHTNEAWVSRDIRRYPSELDRLQSGDKARNTEVRRKVTFVQVAAGIDGANRTEELTGTTGTETDSAESVAKIDKPFSLWEKEGFGFGDLIDIINPLHHIPIIATIYRNVTGDQIGAAPRVIGGAMWGRIGGFVSGVVNAMVEWWSGKDLGDHIYAALFNDPKAANGATALAQMKESTSGAAPRALATRKARALQIDGVASATSVESPAVNAPASNNAGPGALRFELPATVPPIARVALNSYERNLNRSMADESRRTRWPA